MTLSLNKAAEFLVGPLCSHCCPVPSRYHLSLCFVCDKPAARHTEDERTIHPAGSEEWSVGVNNGTGCMGLGKLLSLSELRLLYL